MYVYNMLIQNCRSVMLSFNLICKVLNLIQGTSFSFKKQGNKTKYFTDRHENSQSVFATNILRIFFTASYQKSKGTARQEGIQTSPTTTCLEV